MALADALSHLYPIPGKEIEFDVAKNHTRTSPDRKTANQDVIQFNPVLHELMHTIKDGLKTPPSYCTGTANIMKPLPLEMEYQCYRR